MKKGLLWYDDSEQDLAEKVERAARRYRKKFGTAPDACYVHPSVLNGNGKMKEVDGVRVMVLPSVLRHHFWLGQEEKPRQRKTAR
ncbi:MAG: hypothetical protein JW918_03605 [Anaerolineae bacterium]|nr:hypothetical protein [Anaerolineae bacterium]